jgi:glycine/D-amino acid oxidase-like deaminating enzyme
MLPDCEHTLDPYRLTVALAEDFVAQGGDHPRGDVRTGSDRTARPQVTTDAGRSRSTRW